ncbi:ABC transporter substrate-binding protein, partial [Rhizobium ruizarguesonis]
MIKLKRRAFLAGTSAVFILPALPVFATEFKEADILKTKVSSGALPALKDRLPENPLVVKPVESVGKYGGDWNMALVGGGSLSMLFRYQAYEPLLRYTPDWSGVTLNVAESFEGDADSRVYTIRLRKGMKWSDGHPYTTADIKFWYDTVFTDKRVAFVGQDHWKSGGKPAKLEIVD